MLVSYVVDLLFEDIWTRISPLSCIDNHLSVAANSKIIGFNIKDLL
jgi:hypothetical protein